MGATAATARVLLDAVSSAQRFVEVFTYVYVLLILVYVITTFVRLPYSLNRLQRFLYDVCEPYVRLYRRFLPPLGPLDLSPFVATVVLLAVSRLIVWLLGHAH